MRFEVRAGGALAILVGLGALSGAVFLLGLVAGYEMARQQESNQQFAAVYPLPSPAAAEPSPSPSTELGSVGALTSTPASIASPAVASGPQVIAPAANSTPEIAAPSPTAATPPPLVAAKPPPARSSAASFDAPADSVGARPEREVVSAPPSSRRKPYSIQIEAVMDRAGAEGMVAKLRRLGYSAYIIETMIGGRTWYRVRVGPYATEQEASEAEGKLHQQYTGGIPTR